jgi:DNA polymerase III sliding clamp (beta) subunit (PCNA family)
MEINRGELLSALKAALPGLGKEEWAQFHCFAFFDGNVVTRNDSICILCPVPELSGFTGAVPGKKLYEFLNSVDQDTVRFEPDDKELRIRFGRAKAGLKMFKEIQIPKLNYDGDWNRLPEDFLEGVRIALPSSSKEDSRYYLKAIHVHGSFVETTNGLCLTRYICKGGMGSKDLLIPVEPCKELLNYKVTSFLVNREASWIHFKTDDGIIFSSRLLEEGTPYPDFSRVINVEGHEIYLPKEVAPALARAGIFSEVDANVKTVNRITIHPLNVKIESGKMTIRSECEAGWFEEEFDIDYVGELIDFGVGAEFIFEACKHQSACIISKDRDRMKFKHDQWEHVVSLRKVYNT